MESTSQQQQAEEHAQQADPDLQGDKMLDIDDGPVMPAPSQPSKKYLEAKAKENAEHVAKVDAEMEKKRQEKVLLQQEKVYQVMKALTAMKLVKEDGVPAMVQPDLYIGSVGSAYNKAGMQAAGITHILTCAANIKPRFPDVSIAELLFQLVNQSIFRILNMNFSTVWTAQIKAYSPMQNTLINSSTEQLLPTKRASLQQAKC